jgi:hypothetical protein
MLAIASLAALAIIAGVNDVDTLSTIALALAIVAFGVQILVFLAQTWIANQQTAQTQALNASTAALLTKVEVSVEGTRQVLTSQFDRVLRHALRGGVPAKGENGEGDTEAALHRDHLAALRSLSPDYEEPSPSPEDTRIIELLRSYPSEDEGKNLVSVVNSLPALVASQLQRYGEAEVDSRRVGSPPGLWLRPSGAPLSDALVERGFLEIVDQPDPSGRGRRFARLTDDGRQAARLFTAAGPVPDYFAEAVKES